MKKIRIVKKNDEESTEYAVGDVFPVEGTWYGGVHIQGKTGVPVSLDMDEYQELSEDLPSEVYEKAAGYWKERDAQGVKLERETLKKAVEDYILANNTCALACGAGDFVRCTPIEYAYRDGAFWMFSEGGEKFYALERNKHVCLAIFDKYQGFGKLKGLQVSGTARLVEPFSREYLDAAAFRHIPREALERMETPMNLICVTPGAMTFLNSDFRREGADSRQTLEADGKA